MKRERKSRNQNKTFYMLLDIRHDIRDTRYWGVFNTNKNGVEIKIDPKRYQKKLEIDFSPEMLKIINNRKTHYFYPRKTHRNDYNCNVFLSELSDIKSYWYSEYKKMIQREVGRVKKYKEIKASDYYNFQCGISSIGAAQARANYLNIFGKMLYDNEINKTV